MEGFTRTGSIVVTVTKSTENQTVSTTIVMMYHHPFIHTWNAVKKFYYSSYMTSNIRQLIHTCSTGTYSVFSKVYRCSYGMYGTCISVPFDMLLLFVLVVGGGKDTVIRGVLYYLSFVFVSRKGVLRHSKFSTDQPKKNPTTQK